MSRAGPFCQDPGTSVKSNKSQLCNYMTTGPARLAGISANRAKTDFPCNRIYRASPANQDSKKKLPQSKPAHLQIYGLIKLSFFSLNN